MLPNHGENLAEGHLLSDESAILTCYLENIGW
jgi:hypothetical protein